METAAHRRITESGYRVGEYEQECQSGTQARYHHLCLTPSRPVAQHRSLPKNNQGGVCQCYAAAPAPGSFSVPRITKARGFHKKL